ncbi:MAG: hypothetical protein CM15mV12_1480 [uncultured marine virus]|nr:MAG: hypothetical protein CM15mV12_1480 [uncultured marine virus]
MPAVSKKQQQFFGIVRAIQKGEQAPTTPETAKAAADMKKSDVKKFASTKHKGLPNKVVQKEELDTNDKPFLKNSGKLRKGSKTHAKQADDLEKAMKEESNPRIPRKNPVNLQVQKNILTYILMKILKELYMDSVLRTNLLLKHLSQRYVIHQDRMLIRFKRLLLLWNKGRERWVKPLKQRSIESLSMR